MNRASLGAPRTGPTNWVTSVAFSPDDRSLTAGNSDGSIWLWTAPVYPVGHGSDKPGGKPRAGRARADDLVLLHSCSQVRWPTVWLDEPRAAGSRFVSLRLLYPVMIRLSGWLVLPGPPQKVWKIRRPE